MGIDNYQVSVFNSNTPVLGTADNYVIQDL